MPTPRVALGAASAPPPARIVLLPETEERLRTIRRRLGGLLAAYLVGIQLVLAVEATTWHWPPQLEVAWPMTAAATSLALLRGAPLGYFVAFALRRRAALGRGAAGGALLGAVVELAAWVDERTVRPLAIVLTAFSAVCGAITFLVLARRLRARAASDAAILAPDLPLVGGAYVSAPLLWLASSGTAQADRGAPAWCLLLLALYGASLIGSARASRGPAAGGVAAHVAAASAWALCGLAPLLPSAPTEVLAIVAAAATFAALHPLLLGVSARDRRVEAPALRRALPLLLAYLALSALGPIAAVRAGRPGEWPTWAALAAATPAWRWAEQIAAFATLGYAVAELRGRREERRGVAWRAVAPWVVAAAVVATALRAAAGAGVTPIQLAARLVVGVASCVMAARAGVGLYALQRRHARAHAREGQGLRTAPPPRATEPAARAGATVREVDPTTWVAVVPDATAVARA